MIHAAPGDRSHIPEELRPIFQVVSGQLEQLKQRIAESAKKAGLDSEFETLEKNIKVRGLPCPPCHRADSELIWRLQRDAPPEAEWWDAALLPSKSYDDLEEGMANLNIRNDHSPITLYVQHPIPIPAPGDKNKPNFKPLKLTKKEQLAAKKAEEKAKADEKRAEKARKAAEEAEEEARRAEEEAAEAARKAEEEAEAALQATQEAAAAAAAATTAADVMAAADLATDAQHARDEAAQAIEEAKTEAAEAEQKEEAAADAWQEVTQAEAAAEQAEETAGTGEEGANNAIEVAQPAEDDEWGAWPPAKVKKGKKGGASAAATPDAISRQASEAPDSGFATAGKKKKGKKGK